MQQLIPCAIKLKAFHNKNLENKLTRDELVKESPKESAKEKLKKLKMAHGLEKDLNKDLNKAKRRI